jgi:N,N-dimethylformamidase
MQITPDGDYTQTGVGWNKHGYANPLLHQYVEAPQRSGLYYFHARTARGAEFSFPWIVAPRQPASPIAVLASNITWNAYNNFGGRSNYINPDRLPVTPTVNARLDLKRYTDPDNVTYDTDEYAPLAYYETAAGGAVFSASSIAWPSAILVDDCVSRITANVLRRFLD